MRNNLRVTSVLFKVVLRAPTHGKLRVGLFPSWFNPCLRPTTWLDRSGKSLYHRDNWLPYSQPEVRDTQKGWRELSPYIGPMKSRLCLSIEWCAKPLTEGEQIIFSCYFGLLWSIWLFQGWLEKHSILLDSINYAWANPIGLDSCLTG